MNLISQIHDFPGDPLVYIQRFPLANLSQDTLLSNH
jgi:hypothetical protein